jgi:hypothetical protein
MIEGISSRYFNDIDGKVKPSATISLFYLLCIRTWKRYIKNWLKQIPALAPFRLMTPTIHVPSGLPMLSVLSLMPYVNISGNPSAPSSHYRTRNWTFSSARYRMGWTNLATADAQQMSGPFSLCELFNHYRSRLRNPRNLPPLLVPEPRVSSLRFFTSSPRSPVRPRMRNFE